MASVHDKDLDMNPLEGDEDMECGESEFDESNSSIVDEKFDSIVGHIEDIIMQDEFQKLQEQFYQKWYKEFDDSEENKFIYTDIHKEYTSLIEQHLETELVKRIPDFSMEEFSRQITERKDELDGEVFEILLTFTDFIAFKDMMLDYKMQIEGKTVDLSCGLCITPLSSSCGPSTSTSTSTQPHTGKR